MNPYIKAQIENMIQYTTTFKKACEMAALQDDKKIDKEEAKELRQINKAIETFQKELNKVIKP